MIRISQNAAYLAQKNHWKASRMEEAMHQSNMENARMLKQAGKEISSITDHSLDDLRRMGHPYAVRRPRPPHEAHIIHHQTGGRWLNFRAGWRATTKRSGGNFELRFTNVSPVAAFLEFGTKFMIKRGPINWVIANNWEAMQRNHRRQYRKVLHAETGR